MSSFHTILQSDSQDAISEFERFKDMWLVVLCFVLPAVFFAVVAFLACLRYRKHRSQNVTVKFSENSAGGRSDSFGYCIPIHVEDTDAGTTFMYPVNSTPRP